MVFNTHSIRNWFFHLIILSAIIGTAWLGIWQLQRREWKHALIATMQEHLGQPEAQWNGETTPEWFWRRVTFSGFFDFDHKFLVPRYALDCETHQMIWGYDVIYIVQPDSTDSGSDILVDSGWVIAKGLSDLTDQQNKTYQFSGILRPFQPNIAFMPTQQEHQWAYISPKMYQAANQPVLPLYFQEIRPYACSTSAKGLPDPNSLTDNHLQYAITWFALAGVLLALYIYRTWLQSSAKTRRPARFKDSF